MPIRSTPLVNNEIYHVLNRGNGAIPIFKNKWDFKKFLEIMFYYQNSNPPLRLSQFLLLPANERSNFETEFRQKKDFLVEIIAYCLMPNHFHFLLRQIKNNGIFQFMRLFQNSYSHHFNKKNKRKGGLFEDRFKAILVETDNQLLHLSRYIHLNPYSSHLVKDFPSLLVYQYSSLPEYLAPVNLQYCQKEIILGQFSSPCAYKKFVLDQADYQKNLEQVKHQTLER